MTKDPRLEREWTVLSLSMPDPETAIDILHLVSQLDEDVELEQMGKTPGSTIEIDLGQLTEIQRETFLFAVREGYYESPREVNLDDICEEYGVSKNAISQRIRAAENKITSQILTNASSRLANP